MTSPLTSPAPPSASSPQRDRNGAESPSLGECAAFVAKLRQWLPVDRDSPGERSRKRAALASLRRGLGKAPGEASEMFPYIIPALPEHIRERDEEACFLIASLFAWHQLDWPYTTDAPKANRSFGVSYRRLADKTESDSIEKRFIALLNAHRDDLTEHLRHAVGLLKSAEIPIDWTLALHDVLRWDDVNRRVQLSWAQGYWGTFGAAPGTATTPTDTASQASD